jgi:hypothetical protein
LVFHGYINEIHGSRSTIPRKNLVHIYIYIYDVKFLALLGAQYIYDISRLRVKFTKFLNLKTLTNIGKCRLSQCGLRSGPRQFHGPGALPPGNNPRTHH